MQYMKVNNHGKMQIFYLYSHVIFYRIGGKKMTKKIKNLLSMGSIMIVFLIILLILIGYSIKANSLPKCDSSFAQEQVKEILNYNDNYIYDNISFDVIVPEEYDKDLKKYICSAELTTHSTNNSIEALNTHHESIKYTIYKEQGKNEVIVHRNRREGWGY